MNWTDIQNQWQKEAAEQPQFSIPNTSKIQSLEREMKYFYQENGKQSSLIASGFFLLMAILMLFILIKDGFSEFNLGYMIFLFVPVAITNFLRGLLIKRVPPEENMKLFLTSSLRDVRLSIFQQWGIGTMVFLFWIYMFFGESGKGLTSIKAGFLMMLPFIFIAGVLLWWYQNHHPYNVYRLNKTLSKLISEFDEK